MKTEGMIVVFEINVNYFQKLFFPHFYHENFLR